MPDREKVIRNLILIIQSKITHIVDTGNGLIELQQLAIDALALLKEQEAVVKQWTKEIADNQLAHAPNDSPMSLDEQFECEYKRGIWDGLQIAWNIISEGR